MGKVQELFSTLSEDDVLNMMKAEFKYYCRPAGYLADIATLGSSVMVQTNPRIYIQSNNSEVVSMMDMLTEQKVGRGVKAIYDVLKDDGSV
jgi:hypothetical protein